MTVDGCSFHSGGAKRSGNRSFTVGDTLDAQQRDQLRKLRAHAFRAAVRIDNIEAVDSSVASRGSSDWPGGRTLLRPATT